MRDVFVGNTLIVALYVLACGSLAYHLLHGFQSAFKTIGIHNKKISGLNQEQLKNGVVCASAGNHAPDQR